MGPWVSPSVRRAVVASFAVSDTAFEVHAEEVTANRVSSFPSSIGAGRDAKPVLPTAVKGGAEEIFPGAGRVRRGRVTSAEALRAFRRRTSSLHHPAGRAPQPTPARAAAAPAESADSAVSRSMPLVSFSGFSLMNSTAITARAATGVATRKSSAVAIP